MAVSVKRWSVWFILAAVVGCKDLTFDTGIPALTGVWAGAFDSSTMTLVLHQEPRDVNVQGSGYLSFADTTVALEVLSGLHVHPSVSLVLDSDGGRFSLIGTMSPREEPLTYGLHTVTIMGELNGSGFEHQMVVLTRQDPTSTDVP